MNMFTFSTVFCCILFCGFLGMIYFSQKKLLNRKNTIYKNMLILDFIILSSSMISLLSANYISISSNLSFIYDIFTRVYSTTELLWCLLLSIYTIIIISEGNSLIENLVNDKNTIKLTKIIILILSIVSFVLPAQYTYNTDNILIYSGIRLNYITYLLFGIFSATTILVIFNFKHVKKIKILPFLVFDVLLISLFLISRYDPSTNVFPLVITLISYLLYHTMENPDYNLISELGKAKELAEASNKAKSEFLSNISHEVRTPLNAIVGLSEMITESDDYESMHSDSKDIYIASQNLLGIVNGILDVNRLETQQMSVINNNYNPVEEFNKIANTAKLRIGSKPIQLVTNYTSDIPVELNGDIDKIQKIIANILNNAIKYTNSGFVYFNVSCKKKNEKCELIFSIRDTGRGIKETEKSKLFTKFYRLEEDKGTTIEGVGLGLAITKLLVNLLGGSITFDSIYGQGSTFTIELEQTIVTDFSTQNKEELTII